MKVRQLAPLLLLLLVVAMVTSAAAGLLPDAHAFEAAGHGEGSPCPDPGDDGGPCGADCPCACCPGFAAAAAFMPARPLLEVPPTNRFAAASSDLGGPAQVVSGIFHPPQI